MADSVTYSPRRVITGYLSVYTLFTLASSLIWAINTIFLIREGGLSIFEVMIVNASFTVGQMIFEVPTGVVADTIGRKASLLLGMATLAVSTLLYVATPVFGLGIAGFLLASVLLGLGFTFQTGALDAWLVDALDATGWERPKERVFSWGMMAGNAAMLVGSLLGGFLGQVGLAVPYLVRTGLLILAFLATALLIADLGFTPRPLKVSTFGDETRRIFRAGLNYGWRSPVIRPLLWGSGFSGLFFIYAFYSWQPYVLELIGRDYVWLLGVVTAGFSLAGIIGNSLVSRIMREGEARRRPWRVLEGTAWISVALALGIAAVGPLSGGPGFLPAAIAITLWLLWGLTYGVSMPVRMSYINTYIPSAQRATVLSLDSFFLDAGGAVGQPALGWISQRFSIPAGWFVGAAFLAFTPLLYRASGKAASAECDGVECEVLRTKLSAAPGGPDAAPVERPSRAA
jgi:MFS family permease